MSRIEILRAVKNGKLSVSTATRLEHAQCVIRKAGLSPNRKNVLQALVMGAVTKTAADRLIAAESAARREMATVA